MPTALYLFLTIMLLLTVIPVWITASDILECRKSDKGRFAASPIKTRAREMVLIPARHDRRPHSLRRPAANLDSRLRGLLRAA